MAAPVVQQALRRYRPFVSIRRLTSGANRPRIMLAAAGRNGSAPIEKGDNIGSTERVVNLSDVLNEARQLSPNLVFEDFDPNEPPWVPPPPIPDHPEIPTPVKPEEAPAPEPLPAALNPLMNASAYSPEQGFKELTVQQVYDRMQAGGVSLVLDVREKYELEEYGTLTGAMHIPLADVSTAARSGRLDDFREAPIVVICAAGIRSAQATVKLTKVLGFKDVTNMQGGVYSWMEAGLPLVQTW